MLLTWLILGVAFSIPELTLYFHFSWFRRLMDANQILQVVISLGLGIAMAFVLSVPAGLTIAVGNVFGTMITKAIYALGLFKRWNRAKVSIGNAKQSVVRARAKVQQIRQQIHAVWMFLTWPYQLVMKLSKTNKVK